MPLLILSSKIVAVLPPRLDSSIMNFLSICKSFIKVTDGNAEDPFKDKLIARCIDVPSSTTDDSAENDFVEYANKLTEGSQISDNFKKQNIHPIYAPSGP